jgi:hypothetical protein
MNKFLSGLILAAMLLCNVDAATRSSGSSSRSSSSGSRSSGSWGSKSSAAPKPAAPAPKPSTPAPSTPSKSWGSSKPAAPAIAPTTQPKVAPKPSATDTALKAKSVQTANTKTREQATTEFKQKNAAQYTSKYVSEPKTRPTHIPTTTMVGGNNYNVVYNGGFGGYGYYNSLGTWIMYDAMMDTMMLSMLMNNHGHYNYSHTTTMTTHYITNSDGSVTTKIEKEKGNNSSLGAWVFFWTMITLCVAGTISVWIYVRR